MTAVSSQTDVSAAEIANGTYPRDGELIVMSEKGRSTRVALKTTRCVITKKGAFHNLVVDEDIYNRLFSYIAYRLEEIFTPAGYETFKKEAFVMEMEDEGRRLFAFKNVALAQDWAKSDASDYLVFSILFWKKAGAVRCRLVDLHMLMDDVSENSRMETNKPAPQPVKLSTQECVFNGFGLKKEEEEEEDDVAM